MAGDLRPAGVGFDDPRREREWTILARRYLTYTGPQVNVACAAGITTLAIVLAAPMQDALYGVVATPAWGTTVWVTPKLATGFTLNFGTAAPSGGSFLDYILVRHA